MPPKVQAAFYRESSLFQFTLSAHTAMYFPYICDSFSLSARRKKVQKTFTTDAICRSRDATLLFMGSTENLRFRDACNRTEAVKEYA